LLHCLNDTAESCKLSDNVSETERKRLQLHALTSFTLHPRTTGIKLSDEDNKPSSLSATPTTTITLADNHIFIFLGNIIPSYLFN
jgi:hypothetical protein